MEQKLEDRDGYGEKIKSSPYSRVILQSEKNMRHNEKNKRIPTKPVPP